MFTKTVTTEIMDAIVQAMPIISTAGFAWLWWIASRQKKCKTQSTQRVVRLITLATVIVFNVIIITPIIILTVRSKLWAIGAFTTIAVAAMFGLSSYLVYYLHKPKPD